MRGATIRGAHRVSMILQRHFLRRPVTITTSSSIASSAAIGKPFTGSFTAFAETTKTPRMRSSKRF